MTAHLPNSLFPSRKAIIMGRNRLRGGMYYALAKTKFSSPPLQKRLKAAIDRIFKANWNNHYLSLSLEDPSAVSYAKRPEIVHKYDRVRRTKTRLGRYLCQLDDVFSVWSGLSEFCDVAITYANPPSNDWFKVVGGDEVFRVYRDVAYSCMSDSPYVELYANNPDKVKMLVYRNIGRALLWTTDDGTKVMDRIYPHSGIHLQHMKNWAKRNGYLTRINNCLPSGDVLFEDQKPHQVTLDVVKYIPYMDSFHYMDEAEQNSRCTFYTHYNDRPIACESESGWPSTGYRCCECGDRVEDGDEYSAEGDYWCSFCYHDNFQECYRCSDVERADSLVGVDLNEWCGYCADAYATLCDDCGVLTEHTQETVDGTDVCGDCSGNYSTCSDCGLLHTTDGTVCEDCLEPVAVG